MKINIPFFIGVSFLLLIVSISSCDKDEKTYPFSVEIGGPFTIGDILNNNSVVYKSGLHIFDVNESDIYIIKINNTIEDTLFVKLDSITGLMLKNCRYYSPKENNKFRLVRDFPIVDNGPVVTDTILPSQEKSYYTHIDLINEGVVELYLPIKSKFVDSLNLKNQITVKDQLNFYHPFYLFEIKKREIHNTIDGMNFHSMVQLQN